MSKKGVITKGRSLVEETEDRELDSYDLSSFWVG